MENCDLKKKNLGWQAEVRWKTFSSRKSGQRCDISWLLLEIRIRMAKLT